MLAIWSLVPLPLQNPACIPGSSQFMYCWSQAWRVLSITLLVCKMTTIAWQLEHSLALPFFGIGMKIDLFESCGHCWVFQICWHIECSNLTLSSFRILSSSAGIPSSPLALFVEIFPKARLSSYSRMSSSRWVTMPSWLSGLLRLFLYISSLYSCYFLISSASVGSLPFLSFIMPIFSRNIPLIALTFLKRSLVFPMILFSSISWCCSL